MSKEGPKIDELLGLQFLNSPICLPIHLTHTYILRDLHSTEIGPTISGLLHLHEPLASHVRYVTKPEYTVEAVGNQSKAGKQRLVGRFLFGFVDPGQPIKNRGILA